MVDQPVYNEIGKGYNETRKADPYISSRLFELLQPLEGRSYLDIGCGTGNYTISLAEKGVSISGIDPSMVMLSEARNKNREIQWISGSASQIPFPDNSVDGVVATLTIHHWEDMDIGFSEVSRVMKSGSLFIIFSFTKEQEEGYWLCHFFPEMMKKAFQKVVSMDSITRAAKVSGMEICKVEKYFVTEDIQDLFGYAGKHKPEMYFDPEVRKGISAFSLLATSDEVESGLMKLRNCIDNGEFDAIKKQYDNDLGDYLFIVLKKN